MKRVAHFMLHSELDGSPPNEALVSALLELGYGVDLYAPGFVGTASAAGAIRHFAAEYGYRWLMRNLALPKWSGYAAISGTTEDPWGVAGLIARLHRRPAVVMADEIKSGSYSGDRGRRWKALCQWGMRQAAFTVVNEEERVALQREYVGLVPEAEFLVYPGCFRDPPAPADRGALRSARGIPSSAPLLCYSGTVTFGNGGHWMAEALAGLPELWVWGQIVNRDPLLHELLVRLRGAERLVLEPARLGWRECWATMSAVDVGMVVYVSDAPQFQHMGVASNRLCMFLAMGVPVVASRQPSFAFLERFGCGVLVERAEEVPRAVERVLARRDDMSARALECARQYIRAGERYLVFRERLRSLLCG